MHSDNRLIIDTTSSFSRAWPSGRVHPLEETLPPAVECLPMDQLEKRIKGDWFEIREASQDYLDLKNYFHIAEEKLKPHINKLKYSVEGGIVEYKRGTLSPLFRVLENTKYQSLGIDILESQIQFVHVLLYITLIQRLFAEGSLRFSKKKMKEEEISPKDLNFKNILEDISRRIKENAAFENHPSVKMILLQVNMYRKERDTMKKLLPTIKQESKRAFVLNFKKRYSEIIDKIKRNYIDLLREEEPADETRNVLEMVPLKETQTNLTSQCQTMAKIRSTLTFVRDEKYKTRGILIGLAAEKDVIFGLVEKELKAYEGFAENLDTTKLEDYGTSDIRSLLNRTLRNEIIRFLEREISLQQAIGSV